MNELSRMVALDRIGAAGLDQVVEADTPECAALAERLMIPAVHALRCVFRLRRITGSVIEAAGTLEAEVEQVCVVSLEPFRQAVTEAFTVQFVPAGTEAPDDDLEAPDQIVFEGSAIDIGEASAQQLALALDPYPRRPDLDAPSSPLEPAALPFAALAALRRKQ